MHLFHRRRAYPWGGTGTGCKGLAYGISLSGFRSGPYSRVIDPLLVCEPVLVTGYSAFRLARKRRRAVRASQA